MNKTIHELNALVSLANDDELIVYDVATGTSKKIKKSDLKNQLAGDLIVDAVQDGNLKAVTSNAVFDALAGKANTYYMNVPYSTYTTLESAVKRACDILLAESSFLSGKTVTVCLEWGGNTIVNCLATKYTTDWLIINGNTSNTTFYGGYISGTWEFYNKDSYEPTRYEPTINTTYINDIDVNDGVSIYKTKNGLKTLSGYFITKGAIISSLTLFTFSQEVKPTRPKQLWIPFVDVGTGLSYLLLFDPLSGNMNTWGGVYPNQAGTFFIPAITYL